MQKGSLFVVLKGANMLPEDITWLSATAGIDIKWWPKADEETIYTVRDILPPIEGIHLGPVVLFEEAVVGYDLFGGEVGIAIQLTREVLPPINMTEIIEMTSTELVQS